MNKEAECIRTVANWSIADKAFAYDHKTFDPDKMLNAMPIASPKMDALFQKIQELDADDMKKEGTLYKHMIFTDIKSSAYGAKLLAAGMVAKGFHSAYDEKFTIDTSKLSKTQGHNFALLCSTTLYQKPIGVRFRKHLLDLFNKRPENVHGEMIRFIILDQGFKEGIDLYDVKYVHLFEPLLTTADEKQAIGRSTRLCGQKGLRFDPNLGWPLHVYRYEVEIPEDLHDKLKSSRMFELYLQHSGLDMRKLVFANTLERMCIYGAVDHDLTKNVHEFDIHNKENKSSSIGLRNLFGLLDGGKKKKKHALHPKAPIKKKTFRQMREYIKDRYIKHTWPKAKLENQCVHHGGARIVEFNETQNFIRKYFRPSSSYKGLLLWHSVGTGKCHKRDTPILMFDGTIKLVQDVQVGDFLMGDDSTPRAVLSLAQGTDAMYAIQPKKGNSYTVNSEHVLVLRPNSFHLIRDNKKAKTPYKVEYFDKNIMREDTEHFNTEEEAYAFLSSFTENDKIVEIEVKDYLTLPISTQKILKTFTVGIEFPHKHVSFDPYIMGLWIGDGSSERVYFKIADATVLQHMHEFANRNDLHVTHHGDHYFGLTASRMFSQNSFLTTIQKYNIFEDKHIPFEYKTNSREVRSRVLAGIVDAAGKYVQKIVGFEIPLQSEKLAYDVVYIARSLGYAAFSERDPNSTTYTVFVSAKDMNDIPTVSPSNVIFASEQCTKDPTCQSFSVTPVGNDTYYGFTLNANNRYLLGDFTVTHNTCTAVATSTTSWERHGYNILWVTRHTLKPDIWKNMYKDVCSLVIRDQMKKGKNIPEDAVKTPMKYASKLWLPPISYKQFSNMLAGKNEMYHEMVKRNGSEDILKKTFIIIDEAHKLFADDVSPAERPNVELIYKMINESYEISGKDSARVLLMTATPYTSDPMQMIRLLNLLRPTKDALHENFEAFSESYLDRNGKFSRTGTMEFLNEISGYISYLNREKDARQFSYPVYENIIVPLTRSDRMKKQANVEEISGHVSNLTEDVEEGKQAIKTAQRRIKVDKERLNKQCIEIKAMSSRKECKQMVKAQMSQFELDLLGDLQQKVETDANKLKDLQQKMKTLKKEITDKKSDLSQEAALDMRCDLKH